MREEDLLTYEECAERLKIKTQTLRNLVSKGKVPYIKKSGIGVRFLWRDVFNWMIAGRPLLEFRIAN